MSDTATIDLEQAVRDNYRLWNEGKRDELAQLFRRLGPNGFTVQYVGSPVREGAEAVDEMWDLYGGKCDIEPHEVICNGNEVAAYVSNHMQTPDGVVTLPSLETYKTENGKLEVRYFHRSAH